MRNQALCAFLSIIWVGCGGASPSPASPTETGGEAAADTAGEAAPAAPSTAAGPESGASDRGVTEETTASAGPATSKCDANEAPEGETDNQRKRRLKREKIQECQTVAAAIQKAQLQDTIASVNDKAQLTKVSGQLDTAAGELDALEICVDGLRKLRDEYSSRARTMSAALRKAAKTTEIEQQKAAVAEFRKLHPLQTQFVSKINEFCNAPVE